MKKLKTKNFSSYLLKTKNFRVNPEKQYLLHTFIYATVRYTLGYHPNSLVNQHFNPIRLNTYRIRFIFLFLSILSQENFLETFILTTSWEEHTKLANKENFIRVRTPRRLCTENWVHSNNFIKELQVTYLTLTLSGVEIFL